MLLSNEGQLRSVPPGHRERPRRRHRLTARARFNAGLPQERATKVVQQFHIEQAERHLQSFVCAWLDTHDLMGVRAEAEKCLMQGALNLVQCGAFVAAVKPRP